MAASSALRSVVDIESFIYEYFDAWGGTDEDRIMSYYADNVTVQIPGTLMQGKAALREQFVRPFITAFPGNRHVVKNWIFGRDVVVVEWNFQAEHKGPFQGSAATDARIEVPGCGVYEYDSAKRQITAARIYFDLGTVLKQILDQRDPHLVTDEAAAATTGTIGALGRTPRRRHRDYGVASRSGEDGPREAARHADACRDRACRSATRAADAFAGGEQRIAAEATTSGDAVVVQLRDEPVTGSMLPETILRYVLHTRESVILDDAATPESLFDGSVHRSAARSFSALPAAHEPGQAHRRALSREQPCSPRLRAGTHRGAEAARLAGRDLAREHPVVPRSRRLPPRSSRIRRLVDANIIGIFIWELEGRILEANDAFLTMVGYDREDLVRGRLQLDGADSAGMACSRRQSGCRSSRSAAPCSRSRKSTSGKTAAACPCLSVWRLLTKRGTAVLRTSST